MVILKAVFEAEGLLTKLARDRHELLSPTSREAAGILTSLNCRRGAAGSDVLVDHSIGTFVWHDGHSLRVAR